MLFVLLLAVSQVGFAQVAKPATPVTTEYDLQSVYLYTFGNYTIWPTKLPAGSDFVIGVFGDSKVLAPLREVATKRQVRKHTLKIVNFRSLDDDFTKARILFFSDRSLESERKEIVKRLKGKPVLLVGESPGFLSAGGHCEFRVEGESVAFELRNSTAKASGLSFSAKLLRLSSAAPRPAKEGEVVVGAQ